MTPTSPWKKRRHQTRSPTLRFTPTAWAKLLYLRDRGDTEVGGFGLSSAADLLLVEDVVLVGQLCSAAYVAFDDDSVADYFDDQVDQGLSPARFARIWIHTHPGSSAHPSGTDEETFARCFGTADWALMFILARHGETYARLRFNAGPGGEVLLPVEVDFQAPFAAADPPAWDAEYVRCVEVEEPHFLSLSGETVFLEPTDAMQPSPGACPAERSRRLDQFDLAWEQWDGRNDESL